MAQHQNQNPSDLSPTRYSERRVPQFVGGDIDPTSGNLIPGSKLAAGGNTQPTPTLDSTPAAITDAANLTPATPTTRLGSVGNPPSSSGTDYGDLAKSIGTSVAASAIGKGVGNLFGGGKDSGTGQPAGTSTNLPNAGGFATGGGSGNGGGDALTNLQDYGTVGAGGSPSFPSDLSQSAGPSPAPEPAYSAPTPSYSAPSAPPPSGGFDSGGDDSSGGGGDGTGSVICTELHRQGLLIGDTFEADQTFGAMVRLHHPDVYAGYIVWARHVVKAMRRSKRATRFVNWAAAPWANYMAIRQGRNGFPSIRGVITFHVGWALCALIGAVMAAWRRSARVTRDVLAA